MYSELNKLLSSHLNDAIALIQMVIRGVYVRVNTFQLYMKLLVELKLL